MKIFLSYSFTDIDLVEKISTELHKAGQETLRLDKTLSPGEVITDSLGYQLSQADVFLVILTKNSSSASYINYELGIYSEYARANRESKIIIPVVFDDVSPPFMISHYLYIKANRDNLNEAIEKINYAISNFQGKKIINEERARKITEHIEKTAADYVQETISTLEKREQSLKNKANIWYFIGYISLLAGIALTIFVTILSVKFLGTWVDIVIWGIKAGVILVLLITSSKYSFNLAKTYMNESLKNADRIHAISFGKFFLQVFGKESTPNDIKEIFRDWNIDKPSSFLSLNSNDYDPKLAEILIKTIESVKGLNSK